MATLLLSAAGSALGASFGGSILGLSGAAIGQAVGALVGNAIDQRLFAPGVGGKQTGPRLEQAAVTASTEGAAIPRIQGRSRMQGQIIWATRFEEEAVTKKVTTGGKFNRATTSTTTFSYFANFAVGLCEGPITRIGRIWVDGAELDQTNVTIRTYKGTETQMPDALIEGKEGAGLAPAYRGLAYLVFDRFPLAEYGNHIPQVSVEVYRAVGALETMVPGVAILPGATEFGYHPAEVTKVEGGETTSLNRVTKVADSNWADAMDQLADLAPNCTTVALTVAWFGNDLRAANCSIAPRVDAETKETFKNGTSFSWSVATFTRSTATVTSIGPNGRRAFGGTPCDASVIAAIEDLKSRGYEVLLHPIVLMDIASGNSLPNPYSPDAAAIGQSAYPGRGLITCSPAQGYAGTVDKTASAATQIDSFFTRSDGYNAFVLHMADLAGEAGGVDAFLIGSELSGLTKVRGASNSFPAVSNLISLAASVRAVVGAGTKISYGADWTEYSSHRPDDGTGDVYFAMDSLWANSNIDFVGVQWFAPLTDWRDGTTHLDYAAEGPTSIYDPDYLAAGIEGGEFYDWTYATSSDRENQIRSPITDLAYASPKVFRQKDLRGWWSSVHKHRPGGVRNPAATPWTAGMKPVWFTALACPAVEKGSNQPSAVLDEKSSDQALPWHSNGARDDAVQRAALQTQLAYWAGDPMVERILVWGWDFRPGPIFGQDQRWSDTPAWQRGSWISGRLGAAPAEETFEDIFDRAGFTSFEIRPLGSVVDSVVIGSVASPRSVIEALAPVHHLQAVETGTAVRLDAMAGQPVRAIIDSADLVRRDDQSDPVTRKRAQETDLPQELAMTWSEPTLDDQPAAYKAIRHTTTSRRSVQQSLPVVMSDDKGRAVVETTLREAWTARETLSATLPPSLLALEPGDLIRISGDTSAFRLEDVGEGLGRPINARRADPSSSTLLALPKDAQFRTRASGGALKAGRPSIIFIDGPLLDENERRVAAHIGAVAQPWGDGVAVWRSATLAEFQREVTLRLPAGIGSLINPLPVGPVWRWDRGSQCDIYIPGRTLTSVDDSALFNGANMLAVRQTSGEWEFLQFAEANLIAANSYRLTRLLRGQRGTEFAMGPAAAPAGATVVLIDAAIFRTDTQTDLKDLPLNWRHGPAHLDVTASAFQTQSVTLKGNGLRPFAPVHLRGKRDLVTNDWEISFVRRTRYGGDSWALTEIPLNEASETYILEILNNPGTSVKRSVNLTAPIFTYTAAMQITDFGAVKTSLKVNAAQISATFGRGLTAFENMS